MGHPADDVRVFRSGQDIVQLGREIGVSFPVASVKCRVFRIGGAEEIDAIARVIAIRVIDSTGDQRS